MMFNFHLEQTLEYIRLQVRHNFPLEGKNQALTEKQQFPLPQSHTLPMTEPPNPIRDSQPSNSNTPSNLTNATEKRKIAHFATKVREKYKRNDPNSSLRKLERKGYKD